MWINLYNTQEALQHMWKYEWFDSSIWVSPHEMSQVLLLEKNLFNCEGGVFETNWTNARSDFSAGKLRINHGWRDVIDGKIGDGTRGVLRNAGRGNHLGQRGVESVGYASPHDTSGPIFWSTNAPGLVMGTRGNDAKQLFYQSIYALYSYLKRVIQKRAKLKEQKAEAKTL